MPTITVYSHDLKAALSLLRVYMGLDEPAGHFKDDDRKFVDGYYCVRISNLETALRAQTPGVKKRKKPAAARRSASKSKS